jgi:hypothetical protein
LVAAGDGAPPVGILGLELLLLEVLKGVREDRADPNTAITITIKGV